MAVFDFGSFQANESRQFTDDLTLFGGGIIDADIIVFDVTSEITLSLTAALSFPSKDFQAFYFELAPVTSFIVGSFDGKRRPTASGASLLEDEIRSQQTTSTTDSVSLEPGLYQITVGWQNFFTDSWQPTDTDYTLQFNFSSEDVAPPPAPSPTPIPVPTPIPLPTPVPSPPTPVPPGQQIRGTKGKDQLFGTIGDDRLIGRAGSDLLNGDAGDDILKGGRGQDRLHGGNGEDTFVFIRSELRDRPDKIFDFEVGSDVIDLQKVLKGGRFKSDDPFEDFVRIKGSSQRTKIQVDQNGNKKGNTFKNLAILKGIDVNIVDADSFLI